LIQVKISAALQTPGQAKAKGITIPKFHFHILIKIGWSISAQELIN